MKTKIPKKTKRIAVIYLALLILLYVVIYIVPKVTGLFETTQVLENGTLTVSCEAEGYFVKNETINLASETGTVKYKLAQGTVVKKSTEITEIEAQDNGKAAGQTIHSRYDKYLDNLEDYGGVHSGNESPISGVLSFCMDGNEEYFSIDNLESIKREKTEALNLKERTLERDEVVKGEPVFKISGDDNWYVVCWLDKADAADYGEGTEVELNFPDGNVSAVVSSVKKEGDFYRLVFYSNSYYKTFAETRTADMTIVKSNNTGLICDNECIIEKDGVKGVYVKDKDGDYSFRPVNITASDEKQSVLSEKTFTNDKYELVETVIVHDEVLRHPERVHEEDEAGNPGNSKEDK